MLSMFKPKFKGDQAKLSPTSVNTRYHLEPEVVGEATHTQEVFEVHKKP